MSYEIVGDTKEYKGCLICVSYADTREKAEKSLDRVLHSTEEKYAKARDGYTNIRLVEVENPWYQQDFNYLSTM